MTSIGGGTIDPGDGLDPPVVDVDPRRPPCRLRARLLVVRYGGDDVGPRWRWRITVDGGFWDSGPRILAHGGTLTIGEQIHELTVPGACGTTRIPVIAIRAIESTSWPSDIGDGVGSTALLCLDTASRRQVIVHVPVPERRLWRWPIWPRRRVAVLVFIIDITAVCTT